MKTYVMKCGCRLTRRELARTKRGHSGCPQHPECGTEYIEQACIECGVIIITNPKASTTLRCKECRKKHIRALQKIADAKRRNPKFKAEQKKAKDAAEAAWDCVNRDQCLDEANKDPFIMFLPCYECNKYEPQSSKHIVSDLFSGLPIYTHRPLAENS